MNPTPDAEWQKSPCSSCLTSPCCTHLPLYRFEMENRGHIEFALELLRHDQIEIGLYESGWWMVCYLAPCRFLNLADSKCVVHGTPAKPQICNDYSPVRCWYRRVFAENTSPDFIRFDLARLERLAELLRYDVKGDLEWVPAWEAILDVVRDLPLPVDNISSLPRGSDLASRASSSAPTPPTSLVFPMRTPSRPRDFELLKFRLGFPGIRVGLSPAGWVLVLACRRRLPAASASSIVAAPPIAGLLSDLPVPLFEYDGLAELAERMRSESR